MAPPASNRPVRQQISASKAEKRAAAPRTKPPGETPEERRRRLGAIFEDVVESNRDFLIALAER